MPNDIAYDCRYFLGDRPCIWHKREGAKCVCTRYAPVRQRLLVIKLDAMGDVLRTTALLPALCDSQEGVSISWITRPESVPLLENNPYVTEVIPYGPDVLVQLSARTFDRVINLDAGKISGSLAALARGSRKDGFVLDSAGHILPTNAAARAWLEMGLFDDVKRQNKRSYQSLMLDILGLSSASHRYVFDLTAAERARARDHLSALGLKAGKPVVGLNTGAGGRWQLKQWRLEGFRELIARLVEEDEVQVLLLGGRAEHERNLQLERTSRVPCHYAGCDNELRHFAALLGEMDVVVSGDTLAMHLAIATGRRVVVLFGPTSAAEIDLYGLGEKVYPDMHCLSCYKSTCDFVPNCMDLISVEMVLSAIRRQLSLCPRPAFHWDQAAGQEQITHHTIAESLATKNPA